MPRAYNLPKLTPPAAQPTIAHGDISDVSTRHPRRPIRPVVGAPRTTTSHGRLTLPGSWRRHRFWAILRGNSAASLADRKIPLNWGRHLSLLGRVAGGAPAYGNRAITPSLRRARRVRDLRKSVHATPKGSVPINLTWAAHKAPHNPMGGRFLVGSVERAPLEHGARGVTAM